MNWQGRALGWGWGCLGLAPMKGEGEGGKMGKREPQTAGSLERAWSPWVDTPRAQTAHVGGQAGQEQRLQDLLGCVLALCGSYAGSLKPRS